MRQFTELDRWDLEKFVDAHGLASVVTALADICREKADHVMTNWQDKNLARLWELAGTRLDKCAESSAIQRLP